MVILYPHLPSRGQCWWILVILCKGGQETYWLQRWVYENVFLVSRVSVQLNYHISLSGLSKQLARKESLFSEDINRTIRRYSSRAFIWMATPLGFISRTLSSLVTIVLMSIHQELSFDWISKSDLQESLTKVTNYLCQDKHFWNVSTFLSLYVVSQSHDTRDRAKAEHPATISRVFCESRQRNSHHLLGWLQ